MSIYNNTLTIIVLIKKKVIKKKILTEILDYTDDNDDIIQFIWETIYARAGRANLILLYSAQTNASAVSSIHTFCFDFFEKGYLSYYYYHNRRRLEIVIVSISRKADSLDGISSVVVVGLFIFINYIIPTASIILYGHIISR